MTRPELVTGWGGTAPSAAVRHAPADLDALRTGLREAGDRGLIARGLGRSYGDPAQNGGGGLLDLTGWDRVLDLDLAAPAVTVQAGCSLDRLLRALLPFGLWLPVLPGTRQVSVGGAVAADVHGKNHHRSGSFGSHLSALTLMLASGEVVRVGPEDEGDAGALFWATVGGMGLTGVVLEATIRLSRVETSRFLVDTETTPDLPTLLETLESGDDRYPYSVAWFDTVPRGGRMGRSVITRGDSARLVDLPEDLQAAPLEFDAPQLARVPLTPPISLVSPWTAKVFNALWFHKAPRRRLGELQDITQFFHPLDVVGDWNRLYGPRGFCQYQFVVPFGQEGAFTAAVERIAASGHVSSLNVLKRFGEGNRSPLSFPTAGWTLAVDLPVRPGLDALLDDLDALVVQAGGRLYLAKDSRTRPEHVAAMYPRLDALRAVRDTVDPHRLFRSDLSRRLDL